MSDTYLTGPGMQMTLHFALGLPDGSEVDSTFDKAPATFRWGDGSLLPGFEQALVGLPAGTETTVTIPAEAAFGAPNPNNVHTFRRDQMPTELEPEAGMMLAFTDPGGNELPGVIAAVEGDLVRVDFNHPLAGHDIVFRVHILDVRPTMES